ncbi:copper transporter [Modestobacter sp. I12A-02628]|uniref:Copper transporter n=1 Tax=Goekera deserti TaxID=2497753 RepID=A0A7K3WH38_9ACTN|nr:copper transporter [Goekera deserti]MPQ99754.1 copper transporter [Goekera deserti]NDI46235.1 copper transporter [Goekera deserti]NEL54833.1 copper transporter [Goekera deserti]
MIDFRYHLVSLIAVFLAIALGIVIGTTALNGRLVDNLESQVSGLQEDKRTLEDTNQGLQARLDDVGAFEEAVAPSLVGDTLTGRSVLLVLADDVATEVVDEVSSLLGSAGATVTGTVSITEAYSDPTVAPSLESYVNGPGVPTGVQPTPSSDTGELVAGVLAQVLMTPPAESGQPPAAQTSGELASVLSALAGLDVLSYDTAPTERADFAVVLGTGPLGVGGDADATALLQLVTALDTEGSGVVVAGDAASATGGLVAAVRADATVSAAVSTVDNVDTAAGRISTVLALPAEARALSGAYGTGEDTEPAPPVQQ